MTATARRYLVLVLKDEWLIADAIDLALRAAGYDVLGRLVEFATPWS